MTRIIRSLVEASPLSPLQGELESLPLWNVPYHCGMFHQFVGSSLLRPICLGKKMLFVIGTSQDDETAM